WPKVLLGRRGGRSKTSTMAVAMMTTARATHPQLRGQAARVGQALRILPPPRASPVVVVRMATVTARGRHRGTITSSWVSGNPSKQRFLGRKLARRQDADDADYAEERLDAHGEFQEELDEALRIRKMVETGLHDKALERLMASTEASAHP
ncbi:unnamed protein product, partial [Scytosiphon promiscuus]